MSHNEEPAAHSFEDYMACAHALADAAAAKTILYFRKHLEIENKAHREGHSTVQRDFDPVTTADKDAEVAIRTSLSAEFPDHGLYGEEFGILNPEARLRWIVDPIDGTAAFLMGWPMWGTLIALTEDARPILGLMDQPFTRERFWSGAAKALYRGPDGAERQLATRSCETLSHAILSTTHPELFASAQAREAFLRVSRAARLTRYGGDCYAYAMLASGFGDLVIESGLKPYDVAALIPIVEKAGGVMTTWKGESATNGGDIVAAGDRRIHEAALKILNA
jgi:histidinol-phosphatase